MSATEVAAAALIDEVTAEVAAEQEAAAETEAPQAEAAEVPALEPELPADIQAILEEDPEPEADEEPAFEEPVAEFDEPIDVYQDEDSKLRREYEKLKKKANFLEKQTLKAARPQWQSEIEQYFPLAPAKDIAAQAGSRRDALKRAAEFQAVAKTGAKAVADHYEAAITKIVDERMAAERAALQAQWGRPIGGPGAVPVAAGERADEAAAIQNAPTLYERTLRKIQGGNLGPELYITDSAAGGDE